VSEPQVSLGRPDYTALEFGPPLDDRPYVIANMVSSADGKVVIEGTEQGLGSPDDQALMRELRFHADVVMNGAGTLRASGTSSRVPEALQRRREAAGRTPNPLGAVVTSTGELPLERAFFTARDFEAMVYVSEEAGTPRLDALRATGRPVVVVPVGAGIAWVLRHMRQELDASLLLVEGGPSLNGELFDGGLIDELFLTLGSLVVAGDGTRTAVESERPAALGAVARLELVSAAANRETSEVYLRYRVGGRVGGRGAR
jgi:riboflavin biosynthesis pyrimidine reductase